MFDGNGNQTHRYLYGTQIDQILADETATGMVWALADNQGTVKDLVDNNGVVVNHVTYDSFGKVVAQSNAGVGFRYGYTGREQDGETGLDYYRARYYDASNGRFISEDPIGFNAGDTNIYRYVGNSPVNGTDPSGLEVLTPDKLTPIPGTPTPVKPTFDPRLLIPYLLWEILKPTPVANGELPLNRPVKRPIPTPSPSPEVITPPKPNVCKDDENKKTCHSEFPSHDTPPLYPQELRFSSFTQKDLTIFPQISVMKANRTRIYNDPRELEVVKVENMTKKRYKDPNNVAMHYNIGIFDSNGALGGSIGLYEFCIENNNEPYLQQRFGILNIKSRPNQNNRQSELGNHL